MKAVILKCPVSGQFHFGKIAPDENTSLDDTSAFIHSDTLFSAIINTAAKMMDASKVAELIQWFDRGEWSVSSAFFYLAGEKASVFFLPKPAHYNLLTASDADFDIKSVNRVEFISKGVWEQGILPKDWAQDCIILQNKFVVTKAEIENLVEEASWQDKIEVYRYHSLPKVFIHKEKKEDNLYYQTNVVLSDNYRIDSALQVHYYFLLDTQLDEVKEKTLLQIISMLKYEGIGGERSVGCGHLKAVDFQNFKCEPLEINSTKTVLISLLNPSTDDLKKMQYYKILSRGGRNVEKVIRLKTGQYLKRIKMIAEGGLSSSVVKGQLAEVGRTVTDIPFYRNGKAFCLPIHTKTLPDATN